MSLRKYVRLVLSALLAISLVPAPALAEMVEEAQEATAAIEFRVNAADEDAWVTFATMEEAEQAADAAAQEASDAQEAEDAAARLLSLELNLRGSEGSVAYRTRAAGEAYDDEAPWDSAIPATADEEEPRAAVDLQVRLEGDAAQTHEVWYRGHTAAGWTSWTSDGGSVAADDATDALDDVQVVLVASPQEDQGEDAAQVEDEAPEVTEDVAAEEQAPAEEEPVVSALEAAPEATPAAPAQDAQPSAPVEAPAADQQLTVQAETPVPQVTYQAHVQKKGWMKAVSDGAIAGTTGQALRVEALRISLPEGIAGGITYRAHVQKKGWMPWQSDGDMAGTSGKSLRVEALEIKLTGSIENSYDVWYRTHVQKKGWMAWQSNGATAGTVGKRLRVEALQVVVLPKGSAAPAAASEATVLGADYNTKGSVSYRTSVASMGWLGWVTDGDRSGTTANGAYLCGYSAQLTGTSLSPSDLHYTALMEGGTWQGEVTGGKNAGQPDSAKRLKAIRMRLTGAAEKNFDIYYRTYVSGEGWLAWAKNNAKAGYLDKGKDVQAIQVQLVRRNAKAPAGDDAKSYAYSETPVLTYRGHVQKKGWMKWVKDGKTAGTTGQSLRVEALQAKVTDSSLTGEVQLCAHVQKKGWMSWVGQGQTAGTTGKALRVEAIQAKLTGELAQHYDLYYRVHAQSKGWMGWACNGGKAGTQGLALRLEGIQMKLVPKGGKAPGSTANAFQDASGASKVGWQNPAGYYQVSRYNVKIPSAARAPFNYVTPSRIAVNASRKACVNAFVQRAREYVGTPYKWNYACAPGVGVDCIGLVYQCAYACGMDLGGGTGYNDFNPWAHWITGKGGWHSHDANNFWNYGRAKHVAVSARKKGDVLYWPGHVAIYIGNGQLIEAYTASTGVIYSSLSSRSTPTGCIRLFQ